MTLHVSDITIGKEGVSIDGHLIPGDAIGQEIDIHSIATAVDGDGTRHGVTLTIWSNTLTITNPPETARIRMSAM